MRVASIKFAYSCTMNIAMLMTIASMSVFDLASDVVAFDIQ